MIDFKLLVLRFKIFILHRCYLLVLNLFALQSINIKEETINHENRDNISIDALPSKVPTDHARYHLFNFKHTHEGDYTESKGNIPTDYMRYLTFKT